MIQISFGFPGAGQTQFRFVPLACTTRQTLRNLDLELSGERSTDVASIISIFERLIGLLLAGIENPVRALRKGTHNNN